MNRNFQEYVEWAQIEKKNPVPVAEFDGGYGRDGFIFFMDGKCDKCGTEGRVLSMDGSESEYARGEICKACVLAVFEKETS